MLLEAGVLCRICVLSIPYGKGFKCKLYLIFVKGVLIFLLSVTRNFVVSVWSNFLFLCVFRICYPI